MVQDLGFRMRGKERGREGGREGGRELRVVCSDWG